MPATVPKIRTERLNLRVTADQARLIRKAAQARRANMSSFLVEGACLLAEETLASQQHFIYTEKQWKSFMDALDRAEQKKPRLKKLMGTLSVLEQRLNG